MQRTKKRALSILLATVMVLTIMFAVMPMTAFATGGIISFAPDGDKVTIPVNGLTAVAEITLIEDNVYIFAWLEGTAEANMAMMLDINTSAPGVVIQHGSHYAKRYVVAEGQIFPGHNTETHNFFAWIEISDPEVDIDDLRISLSAEEISSDATAKSLAFSINPYSSIDGPWISIPDFSPTVFEYSVVLPFGTNLYDVRLRSEPNNPYVTLRGIGGSPINENSFLSEVRFIAEDRMTSCTYYITFTTLTDTSTDMVIIDISELGEEGKDNSNAFSSESQWRYEVFGDTDTGNRTLFLTTPGGNYTLKGTNESLLVLVFETAIDANVTLSNVNIGSQQRFNPNIFRTVVDCTVTLDGDNVLDCLYSPTVAAIYDANITINGDGTLRASSGIPNPTGTNAGSSVFFFDSGGDLRIEGNAKITAVSNYEALQIYIGSIFMGDNASLTIINYGSVLYPFATTFQKADPTDTHQWKLTNATLVSGTLTSDTITVSFEAGKTATITREEKRKTKTTIVNGEELKFNVVNDVAVMLIDDQAKLSKILKGDEIVFDLNGYSEVDILVPAAWFADVDKSITFITSNGLSTVKTKTIWNNSGKDRLIKIRNNKVELLNTK